MLEAVIALAVMSLTAAIVTSRASLMLDQIATHAAFQHFRTGLGALRSTAFRTVEPREADAASLPLPPGWSFRSAEPLAALPDGRCTGGAVELLRAERVRALLRPVEDTCLYQRVR